ncbi:unnamed protein product [Echinostoma caproni]|uniref:Ig-like domain-containing protein n=1 Tax=Echinostoma caproni TaxID=27848 RepID=A0A183ADI4_9TREM|nr:unnamed protein product [Echinostoma caproni]
MIASARRWTVHVCLLVNLWTQFTGIVQTTNKDDQTVHLQPSVSLHTNAEESVRTIHMICPTGTRWIVPETIDSSARISIKPYEARGSILTFHLPANNIETRWTYRGLYECCPMRSDVPVPLIWIRRSKQPMCCPCCPWYEQHQCLSDGMLSLELGRNSSTAEGNNPCLSTFLFTGTVNTQAIRLHIVPEEPMLLPCPAPFHTPNVHEAHFPLSIQHRFFLHSAVEMPWFPFPNNNHGIDHTYDPRYGLCLHRAQFPRTTLQLACHYQSTGQVRLVQTVWPPSSPTIPPEVQLRFVNSSAVENPPMWHSLRSPTTSRGTDVITVYRARAGDTVRVQCIGSYSQLRIVKQPPPRLCFSWNWSKKNEVSN